MAEKKPSQKGKLGGTRPGHRSPPLPPKTRYATPRKKTGKTPTGRHRGQMTVREWKDGSAEIHIGKGTVDLIKDPDQIEEWTDEELIRGCREGVSRQPNVIPLAVYQELTRRVLTRVQHKFAAEMMVAVDEHLRLIRSKMVDPAVKLRAIGMLYDRVLGKAPEHVVLDVVGDEPAWRKILSTSVVSTLEQAQAALPPAEEIIDGEVIEDGDEAQAV